MSTSPSTGSRHREADLDADGRLDLVTISPWNNKLGWLRALAIPGTFVTAETILLATKFPQSVIAADMDGDTLIDLVVASLNDLELSVFYNYGAASDTAAGSRAVAVDSTNISLGEAIAKYS